MRSTVSGWCPGALLALGYVAALLSCRGSERTAEVITDSAGIVLVASPGPIWMTESLLEEARVVGSLGGDSGGYPLGDVHEAVLLRDGTVVFIDALTGELKRFSPGSGEASTIARRGQGPGEVLRPGCLQVVPGDSIQVYDQRQGRLSVFDPSGRLAYDLSFLGLHEFPPTQVWRFGDSLLLGVSPMRRQRVVVARSREASLRRTPEAAITYTMEGTLIDTIAVLPGFADLEFPGTSMLPVFGLANPIAVTRSGRLVYGSGEDPQVTIMSTSGDIESIYRLSVPRRAVERDRLVGLVSEDQRVLTMLRTDPESFPPLLPEFLPDFHPVFKSIRVYDGGTIWLGSAEPFRLPSRTWYVVSGDGIWTGELRLPERTHLLAVAGPRLVLRRSDSLDVQRIEVYAVEWPGEHSSGGMGGPSEPLSESYRRQ